MTRHKNLSLASRGLKPTLRIAFYLMSVLPLLVSIYLVSNYILPLVGLKLDISATILISIFIALIGFYVVKGVFDRIVSVSSEAKLIAAGDYNRKLEVVGEDEIEDLSKALNQLTQRIRDNMEELKNYSEKTSAINLDIHKRIFILSSLLEISSLISRGDKLENILNLAIEKSRLLANSDTAYLFIKDEDSDIFYVKAADGLNSERLLQVKIGHDDTIFNKLIAANLPLILDKENVLSENLKIAFFEKFNLNNTLALPVYLKGKTIGILGIGNQGEATLYRKEDIELLGIFAKQIAIAVENDMLVQRIEKLEIRDALTGLYNATFIRNRLQEEIKRAIIYRRPCAFLLLNIDNFQQLHKNLGTLQAEATLKRVASLIKDSFTEIDRVARVGDDEFAAVLPEKNKRQAQEVAEGIRKKIESSFIKEEDINKRLTISGGVSENPLDGTEADELLVKAKESLNLAKAQGKNRIIGFIQK
jgi:diguanylate cyclase (GGDEF)-like protein